MEPERAELYEGLAEDLAGAMIGAIKILVQVFVRVGQRMPFEEWFGVYMEEQGYRQEEFTERLRTSQKEYEGLATDEQAIVFDMAFQKIPKKIERLEIPEAVKGFFSNLAALVRLPKAVQSPVYECDKCQQQFMVPQEDFDKVRCPRCGKQWTKEELPGTSS